MKLKVSDFIKTGKLQPVALNLIKIPDYHDRTDVDSDNIEKLASNMSEVGLLNPVLLEKKDESSYELVSGLRRVASANKLEWETIDAIVFEALDDQSRMLIMIAENAQRQNLNDYDLVVSLIHFLAVSTQKTDEDTKTFLYKVKNYNEGTVKSLTLDEKKLIKSMEDIISRTDKYTLKTLIGKLKVLNFYPEIIKAMQEKRLLFSYAVLLNKVKNIDKMNEILTLFISGQITKDELKKNIRRVLGETKEVSPLHGILKPLRDFNQFSEEKKKMVRDKIDELQRVLAS